MSRDCGRVGEGSARTKENNWIFIIFFLLPKIIFLVDLERCMVHHDGGPPSCLALGFYSTHSIFSGGLAFNMAIKSRAKIT